MAGLRFVELGGVEPLSLTEDFEEPASANYFTDAECLCTEMSRRLGEKNTPSYASYAS
jgi:hypothetical protein